MKEANPTIEWLLGGDPAIRWNTLRALRVLQWWERSQRPGTPGTKVDTGEA
ncbi:MAG: hypothetical protein MUP80_11340 [Acidobacteriia bacterium]|nr:hypothetical protein [Terriglobia bacterium]